MVMVLRFRELFCTKNPPQPPPIARHLLPWYLAQAAPFTSVKTGEGGILAICWSRLQLELEQTCMRSRQPRHVTQHESFSRPGRDGNVMFHQAHQYRTIYISGNTVKWKNLMKEKVWDANRHLLHWETGVHFPHIIICNTVVLLEISLLHICPS